MYTIYCRYQYFGRNPETTKPEIQWTSWFPMSSYIGIEGMTHAETILSCLSKSGRKEKFKHEYEIRNA